VTNCVEQAWNRTARSIARAVFDHMSGRMPCEGRVIPPLNCMNPSCKNVQSSAIVNMLFDVPGSHGFCGIRRERLI
jgi:hypothetical protein